MKTRANFDTASTPGRAARVAAFAAVSLTFTVLSPAVADDGILQDPAVDRIVVVKSERKLYLMHGEEVLRSIDVSLGLVPVGRKEREGDFRTPEGSYHIEAKNSASDYFLSLKISYPNADDRARAGRLGVDPGGQIMIHGLPNEPKYREGRYDGWDWTDGCIAVSNSDMVDLWLMTAVSMPIEIRP